MFLSWFLVDIDLGGTNIHLCPSVVTGMHICVVFDVFTAQLSSKIMHLSLFDSPSMYSQYFLHLPCLGHSIYIHLPPFSQRSSFWGAEDGIIKSRSRSRTSEEARICFVFFFFLRRKKRRVKQRICCLEGWLWVQFEISVPTWKLRCVLLMFFLKSWDLFCWWTGLSILEFKWLKKKCLRQYPYIVPQLPRVPEASDHQIYFVTTTQQLPT